MNNFFEEYLEWIIDKYNDGENINDILTSGYTANTGTYYCPECMYILTSIETYSAVSEGLGLRKKDEAGYYLDCCLNVITNIEGNSAMYNILNIEVSELGEPSNLSIPYCCNTNKFCLESNFSPQNMDFLLGVGVVEQSSSSEIYGTNLCYLFDRLYDEDYSESVVYDIFYAILNNGIYIWCCDGVISANSYDNYITMLDNCEVCSIRWNVPTLDGQSQNDACNLPDPLVGPLFSYNNILNIGDIIYYDGMLSVPFNGNDNWFSLTQLCPESELVFVAQINNNGEIIDIGCP